jgi:hypothetical protein
MASLLGFKTGLFRAPGKAPQSIESTSLVDG